MNNNSIRITMIKYNLKQWQLAEILGVSEFTLSRKLRHELSEAEQKEIVSKIQEWSEKSHE